MGVLFAVEDPAITKSAWPALPSRLRAFDGTTFEDISPEGFFLPSRVRGIAVSENYIVFTTEYAPYYHVYYLKDLAPVPGDWPAQDINGPLNDCLISPDEQYLVIIGVKFLVIRIADREVVVHSDDLDRYIPSYTETSITFFAGNFSPDGQYLAIGSTVSGMFVFRVADWYGFDTLATEGNLRNYVVPMFRQDNTLFDSGGGIFTLPSLEPALQLNQGTASYFIANRAWTRFYFSKPRFLIYEGRIARFNNYAMTHEWYSGYYSWVTATIGCTNQAFYPRNASHHTVRDSYVGFSFNMVLSSDEQHIIQAAATNENQGLVVYDANTLALKPNMLGFPSCSCVAIADIPIRSVRGTVTNISGEPIERRVSLVTRNNPPVVLASVLSDPITGDYELKTFCDAEATLIIEHDEQPTIKRIIPEVNNV